MNFKEWFFPLALAMSVTFAFQYFIGTYAPKGKQEEVSSGQSFVAPELKEAYKPLVLDVTFAKKGDGSVYDHTINTKLASYSFSSKGAVLTAVNVNWQDNQTIITMLPDNKEAFLLGLQGETPLYYDFVRQYEIGNQQQVAVEYQASLEQGLIKKTFILYQDSYQIDVKVSFEGLKKDFTDQIRLFLPMTSSIDGSSEEVKTFKNKVSKKEMLGLEDINLSKQSKEFVFNPKIVGFSNKFIVQSFVGTKQGLAPLRAYFKPLEKKLFDAVIESPVVDSTSELCWSFYFGPKTQEALASVSQPLVETLDYGWLTFIAKPMLVLLEKLEEKSGSYGWAIIILTVLLKLIMLPFSWRSQKSIQAQKEIEKKDAYLRQKYKHDKAAYNQAKAELMMKHGFPTFSSAIPGLLNFPFFISLNRVLSSSVELYGAHFLWISDLSAADPYYVFGLLTGMCMFFVLGTVGIGKRLGLALLIGTVSTYFSSGLALFILVSTFLGALQQALEKSKFVTKLFSRA